MDIVSYGRGQPARLPRPARGPARRPLRIPDAGRAAETGPTIEPVAAPSRPAAEDARPPRAPETRAALRLTPRAPGPLPAPGRVDWVDIAKGICIVLVVTMHATLGVEAEMGRTGFMHTVVAFAKPFRMPDFFLVSGLFLSRVIDRDWRSFADKRVLHFAYFYLLWLVIQSTFKFGQVSNGTLGGFGRHLADGLIQPYSTLWFIYVLAVFSVVTKVLRRVPPVVVFAAAAALQIMPIETGSDLIDEFCERWVFFLAGYMLASHIFRLAEGARARPSLALGGLMVWAAVNAELALTPVDFAGRAAIADLPVIGLAAGLAGAVAIVCAAALLDRLRLGAPLRYAGAHSIVIYLSFFLPMAVTRWVLVASGLVGDPGYVALIVTVVAVLVPLALERLVRGTRWAFLYRRPAWARIPPARTGLTLQPAG